MAAANKTPDNLNYLSNISFRLTMEDSPNITWFCQAASVPGVSIEGIDVFTPHATVPYAGNKVSFEELSIRFIVDEHMKNWVEIYDRIIAMGLAEGHEAREVHLVRRARRQRRGAEEGAQLRVRVRAPLGGEAGEGDAPGHGRARD